MDPLDATGTEIDALQIALASGEVVRIGPSVSLYHTRSRDSEMTAQVATVLEQFLDVAGERIRFGLFGRGHQSTMTRQEVLDWPDRLRDAPLEKAASITLHGGAGAMDAHPVYFSCLLPAAWSPRPGCYISAGFSMEILSTRKTSLAAWTRAACGVFDPDHGHGGFALATNLNWGNNDHVVGQLAAILERFPGLDFPAHPGTNHVYSDGPVAANWLTILSEPFLNKMGGRQNIVQAIVDLEGQALEWDGGLILVAPGLPQLGDSEAGLFPEGYRKVGRMIAALRGAPDASYFNGATDRDMRTFAKIWRARFD